MATATIVESDGIKIHVNYTVDTNNDSTYKITATCYVQAKSSLDGGYSTPTHARCDYTSSTAPTFYIGLGTGATNKVTANFPTFSNKALTTSYQNLTYTSSISYTVSKAHTAQTIKFGIQGGYGYVILYNSNGDFVSQPINWSGNSTPTVSVGVRTSYSVSFNANKPSAASGSVSNVPSPQTKWYGETLTLSSTKPTLSKYTFKSWNTAQGGTGTTYKPGASYTGNADLSLYAQWTWNHTAPKITGCTVTRCLSDGTASDEGTFCKVSATLTADTATETDAKLASATVKVGSNSAESISTLDTNSASQAIVFISNNEVGTDSSERVVVTVTDSKGLSSSITQILSMAFFTMDFLAEGHGIGIGKPATEVGLLDIGIDTNIYGNLYLKSTNIDRDDGTSPSSDAWGRAVIIRDNDGERLGTLTSVKRTTGRIDTGVYAYGEYNGTEVSNGLIIGVNADGTRKITVTDVAPWLTTLFTWGSMTEQTASVTLTTSAAKVTLKTFTGNGCSASSGGIKVASAGTYLVWESLYIGTGYTVGDIVHIKVYKNSSAITDYVYRISSASQYATPSGGPYAITCAANDVLYLYAYNQTGARGTLTSSTSCGLRVLRVG